MRSVAVVSLYRLANVGYQRRPNQLTSRAGAAAVVVLRSPAVQRCRRDRYQPGIREGASAPACPENRRWPGEAAADLGVPACLSVLLGGHAARRAALETAARIRGRRDAFTET